MSKFGGNGKLKKACKMRTCLQLKINGGPQKKSVGSDVNAAGPSRSKAPRRPVAPYNVLPCETSSAEALFKKAWCSRVKGTRAEKERSAEVKWSAWVEKQRKLSGRGGGGEGEGGEGEGGEGEGGEVVEVETEGQHIRDEDLGFASTRRHTPFPAMVLSCKMSSGALKVGFFGTGEILLVSPSNWVPYSEEQAKEYEGDSVVNRSGFSQALSELRAFRLSEERRESSRPSVTPYNNFQGKGRHLKPLTAKSLSEDEQFNQAAFASKMYNQEGAWRCKNCPHFIARLRISAKRHARQCGQRPTKPKKRNAWPKYPCSACSHRQGSLKV